jgi:2-amino-4-hydroxy-6-hydroxymethyldihydropteridine diphosphokinase
MSAVVAYLGLGSNVGDREQFLRSAIKSLEKILYIRKISSIYESLSLKRDGQRNYYNVVMEANSGVEPFNLLEKIKVIEKQIGRRSRERWGQREIDIDIIDIDGIFLDTHALTLPHADMFKRSFVLYPLLELNPNYVHPTIMKPIKKLIDEISDNLDIKIIGELKWQ